MKTKLFALFRTFMIVALAPVISISLVACVPENNEEGNEGNVTSEVAVTGFVDAYGCTYADISGYANLNLLPVASGNPVIGVELVKADAENNTNVIKSTSGSLSGNIFTVSFSELSPATEYKYRSFVTYGGITYYGTKYGSFTTKDVVSITSTGEASEVTYTSAVVRTSVQTEGVDAKDNVYVGFAWSTSKEAIRTGGEFESRKVLFRQVEGSEYSVSLSGLAVNSTYYYASFTMVDGVYVFSSVKSFTTEELTNLVGEVEVSDIMRNSAVLNATIQTDGIENKDNVYVGFAWSTSKETIRPGGVFESTKTSVRSVKDGVYSVSLNHLSRGTTYYYASFTLVDGAYVFSLVKEFTTTDILHLETGAVDLGLSVKWAGCNVGAKSPEDYGDYFAWGETSPKLDYGGMYSITYGSSISSMKSRGIIGSDGNLTAGHDAATTNWGGSWRMPTLDEIKELVNNCSLEWTTINGVYGTLITGPNDNSIFLPAAGYRFNTSLTNAGLDGFYWSATPSSNSNYAYDLGFNSDSYHWHYDTRSDGRTVRPVTK